MNTYEQCQQIIPCTLERHLFKKVLSSYYCCYYYYYYYYYYYFYDDDDKDEGFPVTVAAIRGLEL